MTNRKDGVYAVKLKGEWVFAKWVTNQDMDSSWSCWVIEGKSPPEGSWGFTDKDLDEIDETQSLVNAAKGGFPVTEWTKQWIARVASRATNPQFYEEVAYDLIKWKGQEGAALYCEQMIAARLKQIKELKVYNGDTVSSLQNSINDWGAILSKVRPEPAWVAEMKMRFAKEWEGVPEPFDLYVKMWGEKQAKEDYPDEYEKYLSLINATKKAMSLDVGIPANRMGQMGMEIYTPPNPMYINTSFIEFGMEVKPSPFMVIRDQLDRIIESRKACGIEGTDCYVFGFDDFEALKESEMQCLIHEHPNPIGIDDGCIIHENEKGLWEIFCSFEFYASIKYREYTFHIVTKVFTN